MKLPVGLVLVIAFLLSGCEKTVYVYKYDSSDAFCIKDNTVCIQDVADTGQDIAGESTNDVIAPDDGIQPDVSDAWQDIAGEGANDVIASDDGIQPDVADVGQDIAGESANDVIAPDEGIQPDVSDAWQDIAGETIEYDALADVEVSPPPGTGKWQLIYYHDYRDGPPVNGYGWGIMEFTADGLKLTPSPSDPVDAGAVYFDPFDCPDEWMMKTRFKLVTDGSEAQLLIRDSPKIQAESGIVLYQWNINGKKNQGSVRQMMRGQNYDSIDYFTLPYDIKLNHWYTMTFSFSDGVVRGYVDGVLRIEVPNTPIYPGIYTEPHFTAQIGTSVFQTLELYRKVPAAGK